MTSTNFSICFDGPVPDDHHMNVGDLGRSLLGLHEVFQAAITANEMQLPNVGLRATASVEGSYEVLMLVHQSIPAHAIDLLQGEKAQALETLVAVMVGTKALVGGGVIALAKFLGGRAPDKAVPAPPRITFEAPRTDLQVQGNGNLILVVNAAGEEAAWTRQVVETYNSKRGKKGLQKLITPLLGEDVDELRLKTLGHVETITSDDAVELSRNLGVVDGEESERTTVEQLELVSIHFRPGRKWKFSDGRSTFPVSIRDEQFLQGIDDDTVHFNKGYIFKVRLHVRTWWVDGDLKYDRSIIEVLEPPRKPST